MSHGQPRFWDPRLSSAHTVPSPGCLVPPLPRWLTGSAVAGGTGLCGCPSSTPPPTAPMPFPRRGGSRIICFSCCPDLWATLFFIYLHKLGKATAPSHRPRDSVNTSGSQVSRPARGGRGYGRLPGTARTGGQQPGSLLGPRRVARGTLPCTGPGTEVQPVRTTCFPPPHSRAKD